MKAVPKSRGVDQQFKSLTKAIGASLDALNQEAARFMAQGKYEQADAMAQKGREIQAFIGEVEGYRKHWRDLSKGSPRSRAKGAKTPLWAYYQPILKALDELGGQARKHDFEPVVERLMASTFEASDHDRMSGGRERWQVMIARSRKHLTQEGWLDPKGGAVWRITSAGRKAAKADPSKTRAAWQ